MNLPENKFNKRSPRIHRHIMGNFASSFYIRQHQYNKTLIALTQVDSDDERRREHDLKLFASNNR